MEAAVDGFIGELLTRKGYRSEGVPMTALATRCVPPTDVESTVASSGMPFKDAIEQRAAFTARKCTQAVPTTTSPSWDSD